MARQADSCHSCSNKTCSAGHWTVLRTAANVCNGLKGLVVPGMLKNMQPRCFHKNYVCWSPVRVFCTISELAVNLHRHCYEAEMSPVLALTKFTLGSDKH